MIRMFIIFSEMTEIKINTFAVNPRNGKVGKDTYVYVLY